MRCAVCSTELGAAAAEAPAAVGCSRCGAAHHADCWAYTGSCATFGCGGTAAGPLGAGPASSELVIPEGAALEAGLRLDLRGVGRWLGKRARAWPVTVPAGAGGALVLIAGSWVSRGVSMNDWDAIFAFTAIGVVHGLLAPFLTPIQHRRPFATALVAAGLFVGWAALFANASIPFSTWGIAVVGVWISSAALAGSSLADAISGPRSEAGAARGPASIAVRGLISFLATFALWWVYGAWFGRGGVDSLSDLWAVVLLATMSSVAGLPALERSKALYLESLPPGRR